MATTLPTPRAQGPMLFEDPVVCFSQEECVSLHPAHRSLNGDTTQECFEDMAWMGGEGNTEINQQLNIDSVGPEGLALEKCCPAVPLVCSPEKSSEDEIGHLERTASGGNSTCKKRFISLLVTIENHTPLTELSQCLGNRSLSEILEFPREEVKHEYKCSECDQSFSDNSCLVLHQETHSQEKRYKCGDCGKLFNRRATLRTHRRIHTGQKPYECPDCGNTVRQHSHLSQHLSAHVKVKPHVCGICGRGFLWLPGLAQHQKTHAAKKAYECTTCGKYFGLKKNLALHEKTHTPGTQYWYAQCVKYFGPPSLPTLPEKGAKGDSECSRDCGENLSFSDFKPLKCPDCTMTFLCFSELLSHQGSHQEEKPHQCKTCAQSFMLDSELASHQTSHTGTF